MSFRFGICNEMFENWAFPDVCREARKAGYQGVEISPFTLAERVTDINQLRRREIRAAVTDQGLEVVGLHWLLVSPKGLYINTPDDHLRRQTQDYFRHLVDFCGDLGGSVMILGSPKQRSLLPGVSHDMAWALTKETLAAILPTAADRNVTLCFEPLTPKDTDFINTAAEARRLISELNHPNLKLILDVRSASSEGTPVPQLLAENAEVLAHVHANDPNERGPGFGEADFRPIFAELRRQAYQGWVSVEVFDFSPDPVTIATKSIEYMRQAAGLA